MTTAGQPAVVAVRDIVNAHLKLAEHGYELQPADDLWMLGMSSVNTVGLMLAIEDAFGFEFPEDALNEDTFSSVNAIAAVVARFCQVTDVDA